MARITGPALSALRHRDYRHYLFGQCISLVGTSMQAAALAWLVYQLTGSSLPLATLGAFQYGPLLVLSLPAGALIDRWPKRRVLLMTQSIFLLQALTLAVLVFSGRASYHAVLLLASMYGITVAFDNPCRRAYLIDLVGKPDLLNAVSLNSGLASLARIAGPSLAAIVMVKLGAGWCFLINAVSYLAVLVALLLIRAPGQPAADAARRQLGPEILEGLRSIWSSDTLRVTMTLALMVMVFGLNENIIIPVFADRTLHMGVNAYGALLSAMGIGALLGATVGAGLSHKGITGRLLIGCGLAIGGVQMIVAMTRSFWVSAALLVILGAVSVLFANAASATIQMNAAARLRGRVVSVYTLVEVGTLPAGNAFAGVVMDRLGAPMGFMLGGAVTLVTLAAILVAQRRVVRTSILATAGQTAGSEAKA